AVQRSLQRREGRHTNLGSRRRRRETCQRGERDCRKKEGNTTHPPAPGKSVESADVINATFAAARESMRGPADQDSVSSRGCASSSAERERQAVSAAFCSASFFVEPVPWPSARAATSTVAVNSLRWSGPVSSTLYSSTPSPADAVSSCRLVFQSTPAPRSGASASSPAER